MSDDVKDELIEIHRALGRIEGRLENHGSLEKRIGSLEGWRKWMNGAYAALLGVFAWVFK